MLQLRERLYFFRQKWKKGRSPKVETGISRHVSPTTIRFPSRQVTRRVPEDSRQGAASVYWNSWRQTQRQRFS